jgi:hypothetical protein
MATYMKTNFPTVTPQLKGRAFVNESNVERGHARAHSKGPHRNPTWQQLEQQRSTLLFAKLSSTLATPYNKTNKSQTYYEKEVCSSMPLFTAWNMIRKQDKQLERQQEQKVAIIPTATDRENVKLLAKTLEPKTTAGIRAFQQGKFGLSPFILRFRPRETTTEPKALTTFLANLDSARPEGEDDKARDKFLFIPGDIIVVDTSRPDVGPPGSSVVTFDLMIVRAPFERSRTGPRCEVKSTRLTPVAAGIFSLDPNTPVTIARLGDLVSESGKRLCVPWQSLDLAALTHEGKMELELSEDWCMKIENLIGASEDEDELADEEEKEVLNPALAARMEQQRREQNVMFVANNLRRCDRVRNPTRNFYDLEREIHAGYASRSQLHLNKS